MKNDDRLQLPISKKLKKDLKKKFESCGFSSMNEGLRVFLHSLVYSSNNTAQIFNANNNQEVYIDPYVETVDEATEKAIGEAYEAHKRGESTLIDMDKKDWFEKLLGED